MCMASKVDLAVCFPQARHSAFVTVKVRVAVEQTPMMCDSRSPRKVFTATEKYPDPLGCIRACDLIWTQSPGLILGWGHVAIDSLWYCDLPQFLSTSLWVSCNAWEIFQDTTQSKAVWAEARRKNGTHLKMHFGLLTPTAKSKVGFLLKSAFRIDGILPSRQNGTGIRTCVFS